jgi:two-component system NtrC family sensor kinase
MSERVCLIVDDEPAIRTYLRAILEREHVQSLEAENAAQALRIVQELDGRLDFVVSDIHMPGDMNGMDLAHSIRYRFPAIPVILISGYTNQLDHSGFELVSKPFLTEAILKAVKRALDTNGRPE